MGENRLVKKIHHRVKELYSPTDIYSPALLLTLPTYFNSSRKIIYGHNMSHVVNISKPDFPHVYTGFEKIFGSYSEMFHKMDDGVEIIDKFKRNKYSYLLLTYCKKTNTYDIIERIAYEEFSEGCAAKYDNSLLDSLDIGDKIKKDTTYKKSVSFDEHDLHRIGKELNVLYTISTDTEEDCVVLMNGAENMMNTYKLHTVKVDIPMEAAILLNLYGEGGKDYKPFPLVGEKIKNGILLSMRTVNNMSILHGGKDKYMDYITPTDLTKYVKGKVVDIVAHCNESIDKLPESKTYDQLRDILRDQNEFYFDLYDRLDELLKKSKSEGYNIGRNLYYWRTKAWNFIDAAAFFSDNNEIIKGIRLEFKVVEKVPLVPGSKISGFFGNKGVVGNIFPPEESYRTESGKPIHIICDAFGITGRINIGQLFVVFANEISETVIKKMIELECNNEEEYNRKVHQLVAGEVIDLMSRKDLVEERFKILSKYLSILDTPDNEYIIDHFKSLSNKEKEIFIEKIIRNGIYILQDPNQPTGLEQYEKAWNTYGGKAERIVFPDGTKSARKVVINKLPFIRLKQDPIDKYSVRSKSNINAINHLPAKSYNKKNYQEPYADSAVQFGSYETTHLQLCKEPIGISLFYGILSNSPEGKDFMKNLYTRDLDDEFVEAFAEVVHLGSRKNREILEAKLAPLGIKLVVEMEDGSIG